MALMSDKERDEILVKTQGEVADLVKGMGTLLSIHREFLKQMQQSGGQGGDIAAHDLNGQAHPAMQARLSATEPEDDWNLWLKDCGTATLPPDLANA